MTTTGQETGSRFSTGARPLEMVRQHGLCGVCRSPSSSTAPEFRADWAVATYTSTIPKCIQNGEYLLRIQSLGIHNPTGGVPQFYISCAQVNVTGGGSATPGPTVKIPGAFKATDPGYTANVSFCMQSRKCGRF